MTWTWTLGTAVNLAGALAVVGFGGLVASVRPRTPQAAGVAGFTITFGAATGLINLASAAGAATLSGVAFGWGAVLATLCGLGFLARLWWVLPTPLQRAEHRLLLIPALLVIVWVFPLAARLFTLLFQANEVEALGPPAVAAYLALGLLNAAAWWGLLILIGLRVARANADPHIRRESPLLAGALVLYPATMSRFAFSPDELLRQGGIIAIACTIGAAAFWIWAWTRAGAPRVGRNLAWLTLGVSLLGLIEGIDGLMLTSGLGLQGIARIAAVAILSYAVVRHHLLGIDVKIRWGISKSTVAAIFIAVFFVASEAAQQFFGDTLGSTYVGIAAAGGLVFAIAPLQRVAERFAEKAVPIEAAGAGHVTRDEEIYRQMLHMALRDGRVTHDEEMMLAELADRLNVGARRALELRREVEGEAHARALEA